MEDYRTRLVRNLGKLDLGSATEPLRKFNVGAVVKQRMVHVLIVLYTKIARANQHDSAKGSRTLIGTHFPRYFLGTSERRLNVPYNGMEECSPGF